MLRFTSLRGPALDVVAGALEDVDFRARVGSDAPQDAATVLFLRRPAGWQTALTELAGLHREVVALRAAEPDLRRVERRLEAAEAARAAAEAKATADREAATEARAALAAEREHRRSLEALAAERADALAAGEHAAQAHAAQLTQLQSDLVASHEQLQSLRIEAASDRAIDSDALRAEVVELRTALSGARTAVDAVEDRLAELARHVPEPPPPPQRPDAAPRREHRTPMPVPPGLVAESVDAAHRLVRTADVVVLVDGYNVTIGRWGDRLGLEHQRDRLERAAASAAARTGAEVWIVFDGADGPSSAGTPRSLVRVQFSEPDEEADDVIIRLVSRIPASRPVIVVSDDNRVRRGAVAGGANLFTVEQFLGVCGVDA